MHYVKVLLFFVDVWAQFVLSDQDGVLVGHKSLQEKNYICDLWSLYPVQKKGSWLVLHVHVNRNEKEHSMTKVSSMLLTFLKVFLIHLGDSCR